MKTATTMSALFVCHPFKRIAWADANRRIKDPKKEQQGDGDMMLAEGMTQSVQVSQRQTRACILRRGMELTL